MNKKEYFLHLGLILTLGFMIYFLQINNVSQDVLLAYAQYALVVIPAKNNSVK